MSTSMVVPAAIPAATLKTSVKVRTLLAAPAALAEKAGVLATAVQPTLHVKVYVAVSTLSAVDGKVSLNPAIEGYWLYDLKRKR